MNREFVKFDTRQDRPRYLSQRYADILAEGVLDVGCDKAILREFVKEGSYTGIDRSPEADIHHDLQRGGPLPFEDRSINTVVCTDVLEHLDNFHEVFDDLIRIAKNQLIISLPNNWNAARMRLQRGHGSFSHYGLPLEEPGDRHRWFFSYIEAKNFLLHQAKRHNLNIKELLILEKPRPLWLRAVRRLRYPKMERYLNLYTHTLVCIYER